MHGSISDEAVNSTGRSLSYNSADLRLGMRYSVDVVSPQGKVFTYTTAACRYEVE